MPLRLFSCLPLLSFILAQDAVPPDPNVSLVLVAFRHGDRNPSDYCCNYLESGLGIEGPMQLNKRGKGEGYDFGRFLRQRYVGSTPLSPDYNWTQMRAFSSSAERCQMTLQTALAGLFPNSQETQWNPLYYNWQPIPYFIDDQRLRVYKLNCPEAAEAYRPALQDTLPFLKNILFENKATIEYVMGNVRWTRGDPSKPDERSTLHALADVADNLELMNSSRKILPEWVRRSRLEGKEDQNIFRDILEFAEVQQIACAQYPPCMRMMSGLWLDQIVNLLENKRTGKEKNLNIVLIGSHTETILSAIYGMGVKYEVVKGIGTTAGFILEFREAPWPSVRLIFHQLDKESEGRLVRVVTPCSSGPPGSEWCQLDTFTGLLRKNSFSDFDAGCGLANRTSSFQTLGRTFLFAVSAVIIQYCTTKLF